MPTWPERTIDQCCTKVTSGGTPRRSNPDFYRDGTVPWVKTGELNDRVIDPSAISEWITEEAIKNSSAKILPKNTVLMAMYGDGQTIGTLGLVRSPVSCNQACCAMIPNPDICDARFLFYAIRCYRDAWIKIAHGGAQRNLSGAIIRERKIAVPVLTTQRRIASILSAYDDLIEVNSRRIALVEEMARRLFEEWFVRFRFPGHESCAMLDTPDGPLPEGWRQGVLGDLLTLSYGRALKTDTRVLGSVPVIGSSGVIGWHNEALVKGPGIVVGRKGNVGAIIWSPTDFYPIDTVFFVQTSCPLLFVLHQLRRLTFLNSDAAVPGLNRSAALNIPLTIPRPELMKEYSKQGNPMLDLAEQLRKTNASLAASRDLLLPRLISGELSIAAAERELEAVA